MVDLDKIEHNKINEQYVVPLTLNEDYTYCYIENQKYVELTINVGDYKDLVVKLKLDGMGVLEQYNDRKLCEFHYDYSMIKPWHNISTDKFDGNTLALDSKDQTFLHSLIYNFFDNIKNGNVLGTKSWTLN
jgi:hypothetical protein